MPLKNMMKEKLISCGRDTPLFEVARIMDDENVGAVVIVNEGKPVGILTDRDLALRCVAKKKNVDLVTAEEVMTSVVETVSEEESLFGAIRTMKNGMVRRIVIVNEAGTATSLLSFDDLFSIVADEIEDLKELIQPSDAKLDKSAA